MTITNKYILLDGVNFVTIEYFVAIEHSSILALQKFFPVWKATAFK